MARDTRYEDPYYDPNNPPPEEEPWIPDEPGPFPGDPYGTGVNTYEPPPVYAAQLPPPILEEKKTPPPDDKKDPPPPLPNGPGPTSPAPVGPSAPSGDGSVSSLPPSGGMSIPGSTLPPDISALFSQKPTQTPVQSAYQDALLKYLSRSQETPSLDDPTLAPQVEVYRAQAQRGQERQRLAAAERAAATGQSESGYLDNLIMRGIQDQNMNTAAFNANLLGGEMNKRRDELQAGLRLAAATGDAEAARELQQRLAQVNAAMQQQSLNLQGQLGQGDLALRWGLGMEGLNQRALEIMLGAM